MLSVDQKYIINISLKRTSYFHLPNINTDFVLIKTKIFFIVNNQTLNSSILKISLTSIITHVELYRRVDLSHNWVTKS